MQKEANVEPKGNSACGLWCLPISRSMTSVWNQEDSSRPCDEGLLSRAFVPKVRRPVVICGKTRDVSDAELSVSRESLSCGDGRLVGRGGSSTAYTHDVPGSIATIRMVRGVIQ